MTAFCTDLCSGVDYPGRAPRSRVSYRLQSITSGFKQNLRFTTASHTFTIALAKSKTRGKSVKKERYIIAEHTLLTSHFAQHLHKHASMMVRCRLQAQIPMLKYSYYFSANCTRCPAYHPPGSRPISSNAGLPHLINNATKSTRVRKKKRKRGKEKVTRRMKPCKQKQQIMHCREKIFGICNEGAEKELAGDPRTLAIGCSRQWVS